MSYSVVQKPVNQIVQEMGFKLPIGLNLTRLELINVTKRPSAHDVLNMERNGNFTHSTRVVIYPRKLDNNDKLKQMVNSLNNIINDGKTVVSRNGSHQTIFENPGTTKKIDEVQLQKYIDVVNEFHYISDDEWLNAWVDKYNNLVTKDEEFINNIIKSTEYLNLPIIPLNKDTITDKTHVVKQLVHADAPGYLASNYFDQIEPFSHAILFISALSHGEYTTKNPLEYERFYQWILDNRLHIQRIYGIELYRLGNLYGSGKLRAISLEDTWDIVKKMTVQGKTLKEIEDVLEPIISFKSLSNGEF